VAHIYHVQPWVKTIAARRVQKEYGGSRGSGLHTAAPASSSYPWSWPLGLLSSNVSKAFVQDLCIAVGVRRVASIAEGQNKSDRVHRVTTLGLPPCRQQPNVQWRPSWVNKTGKRMENPETLANALCTAKEFFVGTQPFVRFGGLSGMRAGQPLCEWRRGGWRFVEICLNER